MKKPENYNGPLACAVPSGYIDVTLSSDTSRKGIPSPDHLYYQMRDRVKAALISLGDHLGPESYELYVDAVMEAL